MIEAVFGLQRTVERVVERAIQSAVESAVIRRFIPLLIFGIALYFWGPAPSASADSHYESVIKDAAFRASLELLTVRRLSRYPRA